MSRENLLQTWIFSHTEDDGTKVFESKKNLKNNDEIKDETFEFKENGEFIGISISNNNIHKVTGNYILEGNLIYVHFSNHYMDKTLTIKSLDSNVLKIG